MAMLSCTWDEVRDYVQSIPHLKTALAVGAGLLTTHMVVKRLSAD